MKYLILEMNYIYKEMKFLFIEMNDLFISTDLYIYRNEYLLYFKVIDEISCHLLK